MKSQYLIRTPKGDDFTLALGEKLDTEERVQDFLRDQDVLYKSLSANYWWDWDILSTVRTRPIESGFTERLRDCCGADPEYIRRRLDTFIRRGYITRGSRRSWVNSLRKHNATWLAKYVKDEGE